MALIFYYLIDFSRDVPNLLNRSVKNKSAFQMKSN